MNDFERTLRESGEWQAFQDRKQELETAGMLPGGAYIQARREVVERWAQVEGERRAEPVPAAEIQQARLGFLNDVEWVYQNIHLPESERSPAPSPGAMWLLGATLEDKKHLMAPLMLLAKKAEIDKTELEIRKDCRRTVVQIKELIAKIRSSPL